MKQRTAPAFLLAATTLCAGCVFTGSPLKPDHGFPGDWPALIELGEGLTELNGIYANQGIATTPSGELAPIKLADLVPRDTPRKEPTKATDPVCDECTALEVLSAKHDVLPLPTLRFTLSSGADPHVFDVLSSSKAKSAFYKLEGFGSSTLDERLVRLTRADDGSLIALITGARAALPLVITIAVKNEFVWARFERIGDLSAPGSLPSSAQPADREPDGQPFSTPGGRR